MGASGFGVLESSNPTENQGDAGLELNKSQRKRNKKSKKRQCIARNAESVHHLVISTVVHAVAQFADDKPRAFSELVRKVSTS